MLDPDTWLAQAQELAPGQHRKVGHVCGPGNVLRVAHERDCWRAYCFRCGEPGWVPHPTPTLAERLARLREQEETDNAAIASGKPPLPADFEPTGWPSHARVWLYRAGLGNDDIRQAGIYYCARLDRVVLPVVHGDSLIYWQARGFTPGLAKYLNPPHGRADATARYGDQGPVILVEDILSAIKVGAVARGWAILGTTVSDATAATIREAAAGTRVGLWFDNDKAGRSARAKVLRALGLIGVDTFHIRTDLDPKRYNREDIHRFIYGD